MNYYLLKSFLHMNASKLVAELRISVVELGALSFMGQ